MGSEKKEKIITPENYWVQDEGGWRMVEEGTLQMRVKAEIDDRGLLGILVVLWLRAQLILAGLLNTPVVQPAQSHVYTLDLLLGSPIHLLVSSGKAQANNSHGDDRGTGFLVIYTLVHCHLCLIPLPPISHMSSSKSECKDTTKM
ncbi:hypothetical protein P7K49_027039 [Saguinus oedipus]|uniref:Uncharacterized protein n=1 Tax=Saguinus oedipus TaxID=9490 RepID=A0ABQ9UEV9_SAGOE|nr:hypothetical protein P7K49_027039 [Saguinus oedipus]